MKYSLTIKKVKFKSPDKNKLLESLNYDENYSHKYSLLKGKGGAALLERFSLFALHSNDMEILERINRYPYVPFYYL